MPRKRSSETLLSSATSEMVNSLSLDDLRNGMAPPGRHRPTITDVAHRAGVSRATVSLVLNDVPGARISEPTRERVRAAAKALDFEPDGLAKALSGLKRGPAGRVGAIVMLLTDVTSTWWAHQLLAATRANSPGVMVAAIDCGGDPLALEDYVRRLRGRVDGVILVRTAINTYPPPAQLLKERIVLMGVEVEGDPVPTIMIHDYAGGEVGTRHLLAAGHSRIGLLSDGGFIASQRVEGCQRILAEHGLAFDPALIQPFHENGSGVAAAIDALLALPQPPTALLCPTNPVAVSAYLHLARRGLAVPTDMAIVGQGDDSLANTVEPGLTVTTPPIAEMAALGAQAILSSQPQPGRTTLHCSMVIRQSG